MLKENQCHFANFIHTIETNNFNLADLIVKSIIIKKIKLGWTPISSVTSNSKYNFDINIKTFGPISCFFDESDIDYNQKTIIENINSIYSYSSSLANSENLYEYIRGWNGKWQNKCSNLIRWNYLGKNLCEFANNYHDSRTWQFEQNK